MGNLNKCLYDNLGREYERKNLYLYEIAKLQEGIKNSDGKEKEELKGKLSTLKSKKNEHEYNIKLKNFKDKEKSFLDTLKTKVDNVGSGEIDKISKLMKRLKIAELKLEFYKGFVDLTYDAELVYKQSKIEVDQIPAIIEFAKNAKKELDRATSERNAVSSDDEARVAKELSEYKQEQKIATKNLIAEIKQKYKNKIISSKAKDEGIKVAKLKEKENILIKSFDSKKKYNDEIINNKKHELGKILKEKIRTVDINVADIRRICPVEVEKTTPWGAYATILFPGIGQLLNRQFVKAITMFLGTLYIYFMAIPYALGFGNYKGDGIAGLITLAEGGKRLDRSIMFMIEGILAIMLIVIALTILVLAFKDALKVEKDQIKGIRVSSWCETKEKLFEEGFPYIVSMPALLVTMFIVFIPIATTILLSFTGMDPDHQAKFGWEGLKNYSILITGEGMVGSIFWKILKWTIIWTIGATSLGIFIGFGLALVLNNERIKGKKFFRSIYLLPWAVPAFITIVFFSILSSPNGEITQMLQGVFGEGFSIKNDPFVSKVVLICIQGWLGSSYVFLLSTGVLQSINKDLYEAADIDGATTLSKLTKITIPLVLFQTAPLLIGQFTFNFNNFSNIWLFNEGGPFNPAEFGNLAGETDILISYIYKLTINNQHQAMGAAITVLVSIALMFVAYLGFSRSKAFRKE